MCKLCIKGKYKRLSGNQECTSCAPGKYSTYTGSVIEENCKKCPLNSISLSSSQNVQDCKCNAGSTGQDGDSCIKCESAKYKDSIGNKTCTLCILQSSSPHGSSSISQCQCVAGSNGTAHLLCEYCRPGTYKQNAQDGLCNMCPAAKYSNVIGATISSICQSCPLYSMSPPASTIFEKCICALGFNMSGQMCVAIIAQSELNMVRFYISVSFDMDINVIEITTGILNSIRQNIADQFKIQIIRIGLLQIREQTKSNRHLLSINSLSVSFKVLSCSKNDGNQIKNRL